MKNRLIETLFILFIVVFLSYIINVYYLVLLHGIYTFLLNTWLFIYLFLIPTAVIILAILVIVLRNPIYSLLALILIFFNMSLLLLSLHVEFLAMIFLIIYIGAIAILFLFVIMMFNLRELKESNMVVGIGNSFILYAICLLKFYFLLMEYIYTFIINSQLYALFVQKQSYAIDYFLQYVDNDILLFSNLFYTYYAYLFILMSFILLTAMLGSIVMALYTIENKAI